MERRPGYMETEMTSSTGPAASRASDVGDCPARKPPTSPASTPRAATHRGSASARRIPEPRSRVCCTHLPRPPDLEDLLAVQPLQHLGTVLLQASFAGRFLPWTRPPPCSEGTARPSAFLGWSNGARDSAQVTRDARPSCACIPLAEGTFIEPAPWTQEVPPPPPGRVPCTGMCLLSVPVIIAGRQ
jgi:hypothetical protein